MPNPLDLAYLRERYAYSPETGEVTSKRLGRAVGSDDGKGYIRLCLKGRTVLAHRLAWLLMTGEWPTNLIDHINGKRDDNRWCNLRDVDSATNLQNRAKARRDSASGLIGVSLRKNRTKKPWAAIIRATIGYFATAEEAHAAYLEAKRKLHKGYVESREVQQ